MTLRRALLFLLCPSILLLNGCPSSPPTLPPATPGGGWILQTVVISNVAPIALAPGVSASAVTPKPAIRGHFKTGHRNLAKT